MDTDQLSELTPEELLEAWREAEHELSEVPIGTPEYVEALRRAGEYRDAYYARVATLDSTRTGLLAEG